MLNRKFLRISYAYGFQNSSLGDWLVLRAFSPQHNVFFNLTPHLCYFHGSSLLRTLPPPILEPSGIMRLLQLDGAGNPSLTEFFEDDIPEYAILSHRWGAEEVTFRDLTDGTSKVKAGYGKIQFCGQQARRDGLEYFWVDICCIDKSSSAELLEAINSMFRWY
ncbi:HET-domain-containing protein [Cadophora sp. DSE1049]|nr:HET-domain-containing protein [Cadophora sp. DSE1049]